jgi:signal transduction histidine kinase
MSQVGHALSAPSLPAPEACKTDAAVLLRHVAHELRQPLSTIESIAYYLELILPREDDRGREQLEKLRHLVDQSNWIVTNAVDIVHAKPPAPEFVDVAVLLCDVADEMDAPAIEMRVPDNTPPVRLDPDHGRRLFHNLLSFFEHLSDSGPTRVEATAALGTVTIEISAAATGYPGRCVDSLFDAVSPALPAGSGLSVASVRRVVEAHGGSVDFNIDPELGVVVRIQLRS